MSKPSITNCPNTFFRKVHSFNCIFSSLCCFACVQIRHTPLSGGYCGEVPPLPIPNREVKLTCADGTAMQCGRVGSRLLLSRASDFERFLRLFCFPTDSFFHDDCFWSHRFHRWAQILDLFGLGWRRFWNCSGWDEDVSLFIGLRWINGTLTAFLGLLTDFKRKLDLTVVAIPPKTGKCKPLLGNRKPAYTALAQWP